MLLRPAHLGRTNALALLCLLPMSDRDTDMEILALRHQLSVPERQLGEEERSYGRRAIAACCSAPYRRCARSCEDLLIGCDRSLG
ncbi:hypothetical protein DKG34_39570 [Streptomyces sp. NWU49]|nr:hypothetical protein DKG34_39570 [Streptomyces sp. NWU49]